MVWEEFLRSADKRHIVLVDTDYVAYDDDDDDQEPSAYDGEWSLELDNHEQLSVDPRSSIAQSLLALCSSSRDVATRFLDANRHSEGPLTLYLAQDIFWVPDDLGEFLTPIRCFSMYVPNHDQPFVLSRSRDDLQEPEDAVSFDHNLKDIEYTMISLDAFERLLFWADPKYKWRRGIDSGFFDRKSCMNRFFYRFGGLPNLIVIVDTPRGQLSWDQLQVVDFDDPALYEVDAKCGLGRYLTAFRDYEAMPESFEQANRVYMGAGGHRAGNEHIENSDDSDYVHMLAYIIETTWLCCKTAKASKLSFAFLKA